MTLILHKTTTPATSAVRFGLASSKNERKADLLERSRSLEPVDGVDCADLVARVRRGDAHPVEDAARRMDVRVADRTHKSRIFQKLGALLEETANVPLVVGLLGGAVYGGIKFGWRVGSFWGALAGGAAGGLLTFGIGVLGDRMASPKISH